MYAQDLQIAENISIHSTAILHLLAMTFGIPIKSKVKNTIHKPIWQLVSLPNSEENFEKVNEQNCIPASFFFASIRFFLARSFALSISLPFSIW